MSTKKPLLTISLLISNRPDTIPRCLDSLKPIMEAIPSELILIDTSKSEEIHELLLTYTDKVYEFEWCKDFAKARNEGVRRAKGEWFLYLDDDEWLVEVDELIDFFQKGRYKKCECANIQIRNFLNLAYTEFSESWGTRLFYLGKGAKFEGKIHEYIYPIYGDAMFLQVIANHSGYAFDTEEKRQAHFERNTELLLAAIKDEPSDLRWIAHLIQEYRPEKKWEEIISLCKEYLNGVGELKTPMQRNYFCTLYGGLVEALSFLEENVKALEVCEIALEDERSTDLLKDFLHFYAAVNYVELKKWPDAKMHIEKYFEGYDYFLKNKDAMNSQLGALVVHRVFEKDFMQSASNILIYTELKKENIDIPFAEKDDAKDIKMDALSGLKFVKLMVKLISSMEYTKAFEHFLQNIGQESTLCNWACAEAQQLEGKDEVAFQRVAYAFSKVKSRFWYICYCRIIEADARGNKADVEHAIEELLKELAVVCYMPDRVYEIVDKYDIKIALLWDKVAGEQWLEHVSRLVNKCEDVYIDKAYDYIVNVYGQTNWRAASLPVALAEKQVKAGMDMRVREYHNLLCEYAERKLVLYYYFCEEYGQQPIAPPEVQAAAKIKDYEEAEPSDKKQALIALKEAAELCPDFAHGIGQFFQFYSELEKQRAAKQKEEMEELRVQVIGEVNEMLENKQIDSALQIMVQLKQMFPEDLEVAELTLAVRLKTLE